MNAAERPTEEAARCSAKYQVNQRPLTADGSTVRFYLSLCGQQQDEGMPLASAKAASVRPAAWTSRRRGAKAPSASAPSPLDSPLASPKELALVTSDGNGANSSFMVR